MYEALGETNDGCTTLEKFGTMIFKNFANAHSTIGSMDDLNAATLDDATSFFRTYYAPNNAVLSLVGSFKTEAALALIKKYFEKIPAQPQDVSLVCLACGALSVPRKNLALPDVAAPTRAWRCTSRLSTGRQ